MSESNSQTSSPFAYRIDCLIYLLKIQVVLVAVMAFFFPYYSLKELETGYWIPQTAFNNLELLPFLGVFALSSILAILPNRGMFTRMLIWQGSVLVFIYSLAAFFDATDNQFNTSPDLGMIAVWANFPILCFIVILKKLKKSPPYQPEQHSPNIDDHF